MKKSLLVASLMTSLSLPAYGQQPQWAIHAGVFDSFRSHNAAEVGFEYRFAAQPPLFYLIPAIGLTINDDGGYWAHLGLRYDFPLNEHWALTPNFSLVGYEKGSGKDLGGGLQFRTGLELAYKIDDYSRIGLGIYHLSNGNLHQKNPGAESVFVTYSFSTGTKK
ncbi:acyloxyacyl hydrolase [Methylophaga lonarensis]|uniref:acyloxyacyl hydrolase n=1 Tax=Methylophaga lonarensis TaxID=999151 RepID=UPI003D2E9B84